MGKGSIALRVVYVIMLYGYTFTNSLTQEVR